MDRDGSTVKRRLKRAATFFCFLRRVAQSDAQSSPLFPLKRRDFLLYDVTVPILRDPFIYLLFVGSLYLTYVNFKSILRYFHSEQTLVFL